MIRSWAPFGAIGLALLLVGACAKPNYGDDEDPGVVPLPPRPDADEPEETGTGDASRPDTAQPDAADAAPLPRVFVSSLMSKGNLGGLTGADLFCKNLASGAGLNRLMGRVALDERRRPAGHRAFDRPRGPCIW